LQEAAVLAQLGAPRHRQLNRAGRRALDLEAAPAVEGRAVVDGAQQGQGVGG
jgi:hypothetical protein